MTVSTLQESQRVSALRDPISCWCIHMTPPPRLSAVRSPEATLRCPWNDSETQHRKRFQVWCRFFLSFPPYPGKVDFCIIYKYKANFETNEETALLFRIKNPLSLISSLLMMGCSRWREAKESGQRKLGLRGGHRTCSKGSFSKERQEVGKIPFKGSSSMAGDLLRWGASGRREGVRESPMSLPEGLPAARGFPEVATCSAVFIHEV